MNFEASLDFAKNLDKNDTLSNFRDDFYIPQVGSTSINQIYFAGNSLGLQPKNSRDYVNSEFEVWKKKGVAAHIEGKRPWFSYHEIVTESLSKLLGAKSEEVVAMNSLTTNLHLLMVSFYRPNKKRYKIVIEKGAFPSDYYAVISQLKFHGFDESALIEVKPKENKSTIDTEYFFEQIEKEQEEIALILLGGVQYYTGQLFDIPAIIKRGQDLGCIVGLDLAHAVGNVPLSLHEWKADFAVWCSYKYLNSGPGGIAGSFVHSRHIEKKIPKFNGWWGSEKSSRFKMHSRFIPIPSVESWQLSNPPIFQLAALHASLSIFDRTSIKELRHKSLNLTNYLFFLLQHCNKDDFFEIITPHNSRERGCQLSLKFKNNAQNFFKYLHQNGVACDYRYPDVIRVAPVPLYNTFTEIFKFYELVSEGLK